jgi:hypothetical protein
MIAPAVLLAFALQQPASAAPYWQQRLEYEIVATLDEFRGVLAGTQRVLYHNNSPDTLRTVALHLYLNAFRPGSRWADADSVEERRRFNDLEDPDFGFNRIHEVDIDGQRVTPVYPFAPDSTVVRFTLPRAIAPGERFSMTMGWEARPSIPPRRQGRRGRAYDFAQWYPRVAAYDKYGWAEHPLYPAGEFYGDFGDFRVTLDVPEDQVVGATGVPVCGDPGWERANQAPTRAVEYRRDAYGPPRCEDVAPAAPGRKRMVWEAREVHHFALSMNPGYRYEGGRFGEILVHALYQPGDEVSWGGGVAVGNTELALQWLDELFGPYPWPQMTNVHRIEGGGTEFPMMMHNGSARLGLILHEAGHNYLMGILANNEWREGFLDEGFTSFQTSWYLERHRLPGDSAANERAILLSDLDGWSEPTSLISEQYRDFQTYNAMIYNRGELFFHQLRTIVGEPVMREILRTYSQRWKLKHVDEAAFRAVAEEISRRDLSAFFAQWLHGTVLYDYAIGRVEAGGREAGLAGGPKDGTTGGFVTRVEVVRKSPGVFPVDVVVRSRTDSAITRVNGIAEREWVELTTQGKPREVEVDPWTRAHDWNALNNRKVRGLLGFTRQPRREWYIDSYLSKPTRRDRLTVGVAPALWYNEHAGVVLGGRLRTDYLDRFEQNQVWFSVETERVGQEGSRAPYGMGFHFKHQNPIALYAPRTNHLLEAYWVEGRAGAAASAERQTNRHRRFGAQTYSGAGLRWLVTTDTRYLDPAQWDGGGTVEGSVWLRSAKRRGLWLTAGKLTVGGGAEYRNRGAGLATENSYDAQPFLRLTAEATARRTIGSRGGVAFRAYGGLVESGSRPLKQRQLFLAGADPYEQFVNPMLRSRGAPLAGDDVHYQMPGGGGLRGLAPGTTATRLLAVNAEADRRVFGADTSRAPGPVAPARTRLFGEVRLAAFVDAAIGNGEIPLDGGSTAVVADAGVGLRISHRIGQTPFMTRFDFPLLVSRPRLAVHERSGSLNFRWVVSFSPAF